jgi:hypothetical protein
MKYDKEDVFEVRSVAFAMFLMAKGFWPIGASIAGDRPVYAFDNTAAKQRDALYSSIAVLKSLAEAAKVGAR